MNRLWLLVAAGLWVTSACAARPVSIPPSFAPRVSAGATWDDPQRCRRAVGAGVRLRRAQQRLRLATWNLDGFPYGGTARRTDIDWLACAIVWLDVDLLALQGIVLDARGLRAVEAVRSTLATQSGGAWAYVADESSATSRWRGLLLYREDRLRLSAIATYTWCEERSTAAGGPCVGPTRPALGAYIQSLGGGVDFHLLSIHLDTGSSELEWVRRQQAWSGLAAFFAERQIMHDDADLVVAGDFASSGCLARRILGALQEVELLRDALAAQTPKLTLVEQPTPCTTVDNRGRLSWRAQVVVAAGMAEAQNASARNTGVCAAAGCRPVPVEVTPSFVALSRHCPVVFDLLDEDLDGVGVPRRADDLP